MVNEKNNGWFRVERSQWGSKVLKTNEERFAWADLLSLFNYKDEEIFLVKTQKNTTIHAGQLFTSTRHLSSRWQWQRGRVDRFIFKLERANWIAIYRDTNGTILTLLKSSENATERANDSANNQANNRATDRATDRASNRANERARYKKVNTDKNINNSQDPKNTAKRSGFVWGEDE